MLYRIDCPVDNASFVNASYANLKTQFETHMYKHGWTAAQADVYFPANCWQRPVAVPVA